MFLNYLCPFIKHRNRLLLIRADFHLPHWHLITPQTLLHFNNPRKKMIPERSSPHLFKLLSNCCFYSFFYFLVELPHSSFLNNCPLLNSNRHSVLRGALRNGAALRRSDCGGQRHRSGLTAGEQRAEAGELQLSLPPLLHTRAVTYRSGKAANNLLQGKRKSHWSE